MVGRGPKGVDVSKVYIPSNFFLFGKSKLIYILLEENRKMGLKQFKIDLDHPARSYFAGQVVTGKVILELRQKKHVEGMYGSVSVGTLGLWKLGIKMLLALFFIFMFYQNKPL